VLRGEDPLRAERYAEIAGGLDDAGNMCVGSQALILDQLAERPEATAAGLDVDARPVRRGQSGYLTDTALLTRLVDQKLGHLRDEFIAKGWKWAVAAQSIPYEQKRAMERLMPLDVDFTDKEQKQVAKLEKQLAALQDADELSDESKRIDEIEAELNAIENRPPAFNAEDMARAGAFISVDRNGEVAVDYGYIRPEDHLTEATPDTEGTPAEEVMDIDTEEDEDNDEAFEGDNSKPLKDKLVQDLTAYRTIALRNALANDFNIAFLAVVHNLATGHFYHRSTLSCLQITARGDFPASAQGLDTWSATKAHDARDTAWRKQLPKEEDDLWSALLAMDQATLQTLFAHCAACTINAVKARGLYGNSRQGELRHADQLASALGMHMVEAGWQTTAESYFLARHQRPHPGSGC
jgi:ParB family chromosome partitioning protein